MSAHATWLEIARREHERWLFGFLAVLGGTMCLDLCIEVLWSTPEPTSLPLALVTGTGSLCYAWLASRGTPTSGATAVRFVATSIEVSLPLLIMVMDTRISARHALLDTPAALWVVTILASVLRFVPWLPLWAGVLASAEWMGMYFYLSAGQVWEEPSLQVEAAWRRTTVLLGAGVLAGYLCRSLIDLTQRIETSTIERERVRRAFGAYVAEPVVQRVLSGDLTLTTERRVVTVLFVDIRDFTAFAESRPPQEVLDRLNTALSRFSEVVRDHGGIVNKFLGDGLMALFGAPAGQHEHARHATEAGLAILAAARRLHDEGVWPGLRIGVGVHSGDVVVGDIGGEEQREYTAIGDVVNVASRVESATRALGIEMLITEQVRDALPAGWASTIVDTVRLKGREEPVQVFSVAARIPAPRTSTEVA